MRGRRTVEIAEAVRRPGEDRFPGCAASFRLLRLDEITSVAIPSVGQEAAPRFTSLATRMAFDADYDHVLTMQARCGRLDSAIEDMAADGEFTPIVRRMSCLRGVSTLTGFALAVEIGDWNRFTGNTIRSFVGLPPTQPREESTLRRVLAALRHGDTVRLACQLQVTDELGVAREG